MSISHEVLTDVVQEVLRSLVSGPSLDCTKIVNYLFHDNLYDTVAEFNLIMEKGQSHPIFYFLHV